MKNSYQLYQNTYIMKKQHDALEPYLHSVLKVSAISKSHDYSNPWDPPGFGTSWNGSSFALEYENHKIIVTNAHVSGDSAQLMLRMSSNCQPFQAKVLAVSHVSDLALLTVDDPSFWSQIVCCRLGEMPDVQEKVKVVGFPMGGQEMSVTSGKVNRIEIQSYCHSGVKLLAYQLDAAVNPGNSGGPVFYRNHVSGVAFMGYDGADSINYFIPASILEHFLQDVFYHGNRGFPDLNIEWQGLINPHLRNYCNMSEHQTGVLIKKIDPLSDTKPQLKKKDVLLEIDGHSICNDGTVNLPRPLRNRIKFTHLINQKFIGDTVKMKILRQGKVIDFEITLSKCHRETKKVGLKEYDKVGEYFANSYLAFLPMTQNYLEDAVGEELGSVLKSDRPQIKLGDQCIVLSHIFPHKDTYKYEKFANSNVKKINGIKIRNMHQLIEHFDSWTKPTLSVELKDGDMIVVPFLSPNENKKFLRQFGIQHDRSKNFRTTTTTNSSDASDDNDDGGGDDDGTLKLLGKLLAKKMLTHCENKHEGSDDDDSGDDDSGNDDSGNDEDTNASCNGDEDSDDAGEEEDDESNDVGEDDDGDREDDDSEIDLPKKRKSATIIQGPVKRKKPV